MGSPTPHNFPKQKISLSVFVYILIFFIISSIFEKYMQSSVQNHRQNREVNEEYSMPQGDILRLCSRTRLPCLRVVWVATLGELGAKFRQVAVVSKEHKKVCV